MNTIIQTPGHNFEACLDFYMKLGFDVLSPKNPTLVSDGKALIEINPDSHARAGLKLYRESWGSTVIQLMKVCSVIEQENGYLLADRSGVWIYLVEGSLDISFTMAEHSHSSLGNFAGISLEAIDLGPAGEIYEILGFSKTMGSPEQGWVAYQNADGIGVSIMKPNSCPHMFFNPSMTYFNGGKNVPIIQKIRDAGIPITEEITVFNKEGIVDNVIIRDPGGYGFFIFND